MDKPWKVILAFVGVFAAGAVCGAFIVHRADRNPRQPRPNQTQGYWPQLMQRLEGRLDLTPEQTEKVRAIVQRTQGDVQTLRRENFVNVSKALERMHGEIAAVLTPEQMVKLEEMRKNFLERVERARGEVRGAGRPRN